MMIGPCLCGDTQCPSCGPAQGNWRCPICGAWADDVCEHIGEDGGIKPEFAAEVEAIAAAEAAAEAAYDRLLCEMAADYEEWRNEGK